MPVLTVRCGSYRVLKKLLQDDYGEAMAHYERAGFEELGNLVAAVEVVVLLAEGLPATIRGWEVLETEPVSQMVCEELRPAGQRLHPPGFCEISAVCTHPGYQGRG